MATNYPITQTNALVQTIASSVTVAIANGMQTAQISFSTAAGSFGPPITLSPMQTTAVNVTLQLDTQSLSLSKVQFTPAFLATNGAVQCTGTATDANGKNPVDFAGRVIATWQP